MTTFTDNYLFYLLFVGAYQTVLAAVVAVTVVPLWSRVTSRPYGSYLQYFALLNFFLLVWGGVGNSLWLQLTAPLLSVADDCPVWAPFLPFGRWVLESAAGWPGGWQLHAGATMGQLQWLWVAIALPVWAISFLSASLCRALLARIAHRTSEVDSNSGRAGFTPASPRPAGPSITPPPRATGAGDRA